MQSCKDNISKYSNIIVNINKNSGMLFESFAVKLTYVYYIETYIFVF